MEEKKIPYVEEEYDVVVVGARSEEHTSELSHTDSSRMPSSA